MISRRAFVGSVAGALLVAPCAAGAQPAAGVHRIGVLSPGFSPSAADPPRLITAFRGRLTELGYFEGQNLN